MILFPYPSVPLFHETGRELDSNELKFRFVDENLGGMSLANLFKSGDEVDDGDVRSRVMVGYEGEDEIDALGR